MSLTKGNFFAACHGLIKKGDTYLITKRSDQNDFMSGYWDIPGGTLHYGESLEQTLRREIYEETRLRVAPKRIVAAYTKAFPKWGTQVTQMTFLCPYRGGQVVLNPGEHSAYAWVTKQEFKKYKLIPFLADLVKHKRFE